MHAKICGTHTSSRVDVRCHLPQPSFHICRISSAQHPDSHPHFLLHLLLKVWWLLRGLGLVWRYVCPLLLLQSMQLLTDLLLNLRLQDFLHRRRQKTCRRRCRRLSSSR